MDIKDIKKVHVIGICGVATSALAIAFHKKGIKVTGSDKGFYPPVSTYLSEAGVSYYAGWHPENISKDGKPDLIIAGTASGSQNPETIFAKENGIPLYSFAEAIGKFFVKEFSIVSTGTWGKTSSSALLSFILEKAKFDPTYMFGGVSLSHDSSAKLTDSKYSVFEGDEYKSSPTDNTPKFIYYKPTHLLLSAVSWDHADLYPTEESYFDVFKKLISSTKFIVANKDNSKVRELIGEDAEKNSAKVVWYGKSDTNSDRNEEKSRTNYSYSDVKQTKDGLRFKINDTEISSPMIGRFQAENITGCFAMAAELGISKDVIVSAISEFKGLKRRLEKRLEIKAETVFDDIAHSPEKAASVLENLREIYSGKITAIFEPNTGGRQREAISKYDNAFKNADLVIIPRLTKLKISEDAEDEKPLEGEELAQIIGRTHKNVLYIPDDTELVKKVTGSGEVLAFLGSHGFRGMIEETVKILK